jgi:hypothetical protein
MPPAICGRELVTEANNQNPVTCSFSTEMYFVDGDQVQIAGAKGLTVMNGIHSVKVIDSRTIALLGANGLSQSVYHGGGQAFSLGIPDWKWNDVETKMEFQSKTWDFNFRDTGEYYRITGSAPFIANECQCNSIYNPSPAGCNQAPDYDPCDPCTPCSPPAIPTNPRINQAYCGLDQNCETFTCTTECLPYSACAPNAAYFSPNTETFNKDNTVAHSKNYGWATTIKLDEQYSAMWQGLFRRSMPDPLAFYPPCICSPDEFTGYNDCFNSPNWSQDNGTCQADTMLDAYFPMFNQYEAACSVPAGAPPFPPDAYTGSVGCATQTQLNASVYPNCPTNVCNAPYGYGDYPDGEDCNTYRVYVYEDPWVDQMAREGCVCADGRFAGDYIKNGVFCPTGVVNPP